MRKSSKRSLPKAKGISRIDDPGRHGVGWYARVRYRNVTHSKYFADSAHKGTRNAFKKALAWRNAKEQEIGKPRTDRVVPGRTKSPTRIGGVYRAKKSFVVAWSPAPGIVHREFVSIAEFGREEALRRAIALRQRRERAIYGRVLEEKRTPSKRRR